MGLAEQSQVGPLFLRLAFRSTAATVIELEGPWLRGLAYDLHTLSSTYLGSDENGHDRYETQRTEMGELLYQLKYQRSSAPLTQMMGLLDNVLGIEKFDFIVPIPPTDKSRAWQPVTAIANALSARRSVPVLLDLLEKQPGGRPLKDISEPDKRREALEHSLTLRDSARIVNRNVLLLDDLYRSGATLSVATNMLKSTGTKSVCVLTMTKTRSNR